MSGRGQKPSDDKKKSPPPSSSQAPPPPGTGRARGAAGKPAGPPPPPGAGRGVPPGAAPGRGAPPGGPPPAPGGPGRGVRPVQSPPPAAGPPGGAPQRPVTGQPPKPPGAPPGPSTSGRGAPLGRADQRGAVGAPPHVGLRPDDQKVVSVQGELSNLSLQSSAGSRGSAGRGNLRGTMAEGGALVERHEDTEQRRRKRTKPATLDTKQATFSPTQAHQVQLVSNYYKVQTPTTWKLWQYRVDIKPDTDSTATRKFLLNQHRGPDKRLKEFLFDGTMIFTPQKYVAAIGEGFTLSSKDERTDTIHEIAIKMTKELDEDDHYTIQFWNIVLAQCMEGLKLDRLGRNYFDGKASRKIPQHKLEVWPGYTTSIRNHENSMLLCAETSNKIIRQETALDIMTKHRTSVPAMKAALIGSIVMTRYNNKTYRIDDIDMEKDISKSTFDNKGTQVSFYEYFTKRYGVVMKQKNTPLLVSNPRDADFRRAEQRGFKPPTPVLLAPELCVMTGLTDQMRADYKLMAAVAEYTRLPPTGRVNELKKFATRMTQTKEVKDTLEHWGVKMSSDLERIKAHTLMPEEILPGGKKPAFKYKLDNADWSACFRNWTLFRSIPCEMWGCVFPAKLKTETQNFVKELLSVAPGLGFNLSKSVAFFEIKDDRSASYLQKLDEIIQKRPTMLMCVIPNNRGDQYSAIKKKTYVQNAVPSQVMTGTVIKKEKGLKSVATKVAIQMAAKVGGEPWALKIPVKKVMVVGYDSYHDSSQAGSSIGALIASTNETMTRFHSSCVRQTSSTKAEELARSLAICFKTALTVYQKANGTFPDRILYYRDGVGEGQIEFVRTHELTMLQQVFQDLKFLPKFSFIVVSKRINSRFFMPGSKPNEPFINPPSGTVIDDVVTLPERYDFFLVSQSVRQGTVNPTSYNVIHDSSGLKPAQLQMLTYKFCHLYFNWPGTVRVPAVCQYAHKLAFLAGQSLHQLPNEKLQDLLYYL